MGSNPSATLLSSRQQDLLIAEWSCSEPHQLTRSKQSIYVSEIQLFQSHPSQPFEHVMAPSHPQICQQIFVSFSKGIWDHYRFSMSYKALDVLQKSKTWSDYFLKEINAPQKCCQMPTLSCKKRIQPISSRPEKHAVNKQSQSRINEH